MLWKSLEELARDYNANFCTAIKMLTKDINLGSEGFKISSFCVTSHNAHAKSEEARVRLDNVGEYNLGEMPHKFKAGSLIMPSQQGTCSSVMGASLLSEDTHGSPIKASLDRQNKIDVRVGSQTLFGTVDGTVGLILGLDGPTFAFLSSLHVRSLCMEDGGASR
eukprot:scaffold39038_cov78-Cyclotella_meneghiniana.AAC.2